MSTETRKFYRSRDERIFGGVCAGLAEYLNIDPTLVRVGFVAGTLLGWLVAVPAIYLIIWIVTPEKPLSISAA
jgi:phage shock protein PspC (stress-responsive transcriptional regulator)